MKYILSLCYLATLVVAPKTYADHFKPLVNNDKAKIELGTTINMAVAKCNRAQWGAGSTDLKNGDIRRHHPAWGETTLYPKVRTTLFLKNASEIYSGWSLIAAYTRGQGDASAVSTTSNKPFLLSTEEAYIGWRSGKMFSEENLFDFSVGNQSFRIGDAFVIADGTSDAFGRAAFFLGPRSAYRETAILNINSRPVRGKVFHLRTNTNQRHMRGNDQPRTLMYGGDVEYVSYDPKDPSKEFWTLGATFINVYKSDRQFTGALQRNRDGLQVYNPRLGGFFCPWNRDIRFYGGYVHQKNNKFDRKVNANAYYIEPGYVFSKLWASPLLTYRYMHFSGDANTRSSVKKSYDPLNFGYWTRDGFGTWETGQIYGQFYFTNTNENVHNIQLKLTPTDQHTVGLLYYQIRFDKPAQAGSRSKRAADEWDMYWTWAPYTWFSFTAIVGATTAKDGVRELTIANNPSIDPGRIGKTTSFGYLSATFKF